jgi:dipeptidyl aminopeptidase/acylaminoacyl peptidase
MPGRPHLLIINGEHDDQTPATSAEALAAALTSAGYSPTLRIVPGLSHVLSPQEDIFAPYTADMQPEPVREIAGWLVEALDGR